MFCFPILQVLSWLCTIPTNQTELIAIDSNTFYERKETTKNTVEYSLNITYQSNCAQNDLELNDIIHAKNLAKLRNAKLKKQCEDAIEKIKNILPDMDLEDVD